MASQVHRLPSQPLSQLLNDSPSIKPLSTGIQAFDEMLEGGLYPGQIFEICGIQGSGKSSLSSQFVKNSLIEEKHVLWISSLQCIPIDTIKNYLGIDNENLLSNLNHIRLDSISALFIFIQSLNLKPNKYGLIIIDDFASLISRCFNQFENLNGKNQLQEQKKNKAIQNIFKLLSTYCAINNCICTIFNSSTTLNMSFVETKEDPISNTQQQHQEMRSSQSFIGPLTPKPKPKRLYQQILVSPLGDHPIWSSYFKSRLMLYRDWVTSSSSLNSTAIFVHFKQNRLQRSSNLIPKVIKFQETLNGIIEVGKNDPISSNVSNSFTLDEGDFGTDDEEDEEEEEVDELRTTYMDKNPIVLLESSPSTRHNDISTAKNILPDDLINNKGINSSNQIDDRVIVNPMTTNELYSDGSDKGEDADETIEPEDNENEVPERVMDTSSQKDDTITVLNEKVNEENGGNAVIDDNDDNGQEETNDDDESLTIRTNNNDPNEDNISNKDNVNVNEEEEDDDSIEQLEEEVFNRELKDNQPLKCEINSFTIPNEPLPMSEDTSIEYEEIEDELEELYPTQPESLPIAQLSQIPSPKGYNNMRKRKFDLNNLSNNVKRLRLPLQDSTNLNYDDSYESQLGSDEYIPASAPYF
ncbi:ATP synthase subunit alpha [Wickerhamomyces ciferrii]|uniref:ATP synthase subunit alpha n=1 Tax=Wickerhamomyces ciferrii (strain ATCC 14091 / BCRC 22168 / CBS 111 / JCM 3599 / NBRC 0793 / NRRL Y-1031 F-60-10) TaxID=1206466 RepID=K0KHP4_WICCF|nr:ATP synthase subunit alpha [Wickerhamomyces ciferrii]CCH40894.1 ATP synthase subunit alpha [Wickerhamomyces ciferrii]